MSAKRPLPPPDFLFREAFTCMAGGMAIVDRAGQFIRVNPALCEMLGYSEAEMVRLTVRDVTHPADIETSFAQVNNLYQGLIQSYEMEKRYLHKDGSVVWAALSVSLLRDGAGEPVCMAGQLHDVTALREEQERLTNELVQAAFQSGLGNEVFQSEPGLHLLKIVRAICRESSLLKTKLSEVAMSRLIDRPAMQSLPSKTASLTSREEEVLKLIVGGRNNRQTAAALGISPRTIEVHRASIMRKLGAETPADLARHAIRNGLVRP